MEGDIHTILVIPNKESNEFFSANFTNIITLQYV